jgi:glycosyltransferase involved in cell wall biosynthesis
VQTNPITIEDSIESAEKKKEIIFVGRIDNQAKRVDRILSIWSLLENKFPDWKLILVGEGCDLNNMKDFAEKLKLTRVSFEGYMNPIEYYKRASILMLMSEFEGFPLVLPECMSAGVIPIVYESFLAVHDIVDDNKNGFIISSAKGFDERLVAERVAVLMSDETLRSSMSIEAMKKSASFSLSKICMQWNELLRSSKKN